MKGEKYRAPEQDLLSTETRIIPTRLEPGEIGRTYTRVSDKSIMDGVTIDRMLLDRTQIANDSQLMGAYLHESMHVLQQATDKFAYRWRITLETEAFWEQRIVNLQALDGNALYKHIINKYELNPKEAGGRHSQDAARQLLELLKKGNL
jgi:hypothetical protein